jgi:hypothetical protein
MKETSKDIAEKITKADGFESTIIALMGVKATYDKDMLLGIEKYINDSFSENHKPMPSTCVMLGILLGETIVRNIKGAKWNTKEVDTLYDITVGLELDNSPGEVMINPVIRIENFFKDKEDSIVAMYLMAELMSNYDIFSQEFKDKFLNEEGWITMPDGYRFRFREVKI